MQKNSVSTVNTKVLEHERILKNNLCTDNESNNHAKTAKMPKFHILKRIFSQQFTSHGY